jgi:uncharacterized RDD family membrane protein YckC
MKVECIHCGASGQMDETRIPPGVTSIKCPRCKQAFPIPPIESSTISEPFGEVIQETVAASPAPPPIEPPPLPEAPVPSSPLNQSAIPETPAPPAASPVMADCTVCSGRFPRNEMVRFGIKWVCAACKPGYVQMLAQGKPSPGDMRYAGFGIRFGAKILDGLILWVVSLLISFAAGMAIPKTSPQVALASSVLLLILQIAIAAAYSGYFLGVQRATPGKMACGLEVLTSSGDQISVLRGIGRYFAEGLSSLILLIGYLMVLFDDEKRALHDRICDTRVVYK